MPDKKNTTYNETIIDPRQQIIDDLNHMILPSPLTIGLYANALRQPHDDKIRLLKQDEALHQKKMTEVFMAIRALKGEPVQTKAERRGDFFGHLREEARQIEHQMSHEEE